MRRSLLLFFFLFCVIQLHANIGCVVAGKTLIYPNKTSQVKLGYKIYEKTGSFEGLNTFCYYNTEVLCAMRTLVASECPGCYHETGTGDNYYYGTGTEWYYSLVNNCPLDDYAVYLIISVGFIGALQLRRTAYFNVGKKKY